MMRPVMGSRLGMENTEGTEGTEGTEKDQHGGAETRGQTVGQCGSTGRVPACGRRVRENTSCAHKRPCTHRPLMCTAMCSLARAKRGRDQSVASSVPSCLRVDPVP